MVLTALCSLLTKPNQAIPNSLHNAHLLRHRTDGAPDVDDGTVGMRFTYSAVPDAGAQATLSCDQAVEVLLLVKDESGLALDYEVSTVTGKRKKAATSTVTLANDNKAAKKLQGQAFAKKGHNINNRRRLQDKPDVDIQEGTNDTIEFDANGPGDVVLVQVQIKDEGKTLFRTILAETRLPPPAIASIHLASAQVNDDDSLDLYFTGIPQGNVLLTAVFAIELRGKVLQDHQMEVSAMVDDGHVVLHGGWIRNALETAGVSGSTNGWKLYVTDAVAYREDMVVAELSEKTEAVVPKNKQALSRAPSDEERQVSEEMKMGHKPERTGGVRALQSGGHKKILVHGYW